LHTTAPFILHRTAPLATLANLNDEQCQTLFGTNMVVIKTITIQNLKGGGHSLIIKIVVLVSLVLNLIS
jgi:hypothetical protein